jgi:hypothetical protein
VVEAVGKDREHTVRSERQDRLRFRGLVVWLRIGAPSQAADGDVERPAVGGQPARLLDALDDRRGAARVETHDATSALFRDEDTTEPVDRDAHRTLESARDDPWTSGIETGDGTRFAIGDVDAVVGVDRETTKASEAVGHDFIGSERGDGG